VECSWKNSCHSLSACPIWVVLVPSDSIDPVRSKMTVCSFFDDLDRRRRGEEGETGGGGGGGGRGRTALCVLESWHSLSPPFFRLSPSFSCVPPKNHGSPLPNRRPIFCGRVGLFSCLCGVSSSTKTVQQNPPHTNKQKGRGDTH